MHTFRFLMSKRARARADARLADTLGLRERIAPMSARDRIELVEEKRLAMRYLRRGALADTIALACMALICVGLALPLISGIGHDARLVLLGLVAFPAFRLVNVMDTSQRAYYAVRREVEEILRADVPEISRFENW